MITSSSLFNPFDSAKSLVLLFPFPDRETESPVIHQGLTSRPPDSDDLSASLPIQHPKRDIAAWAFVLLHTLSCLCVPNALFLMASPGCLFFLLEDHFPLGSFHVHCTQPSFTHTTHTQIHLLLFSQLLIKSPVVFALGDDSESIHCTGQLSSLSPRIHCAGNFTGSQNPFHPG